MLLQVHLSTSSPFSLKLAFQMPVYEKECGQGLASVFILYAEVHNFSYQEQVIEPESKYCLFKLGLIACKGEKFFLEPPVAK